MPFQQSANGLLHYQFAVKRFFVVQVRLLGSPVVERVNTFFDGQQPVKVFQQAMENDAALDGFPGGGDQLDEVLAVTVP